MLGAKNKVVLRLADPFFLLFFSESSMCSVYSWLSGNQSNPNIIGQHISEMHSISPFNEIVFVFFSYYLPSCNPTFISFNRVFFLTVPPNFQYQNEKRWAANQRFCCTKFSMDKRSSLVEQRFSFRH